MFTIHHLLIPFSSFLKFGEMGVCMSMKFSVYKLPAKKPFVPGQNDAMITEDSSSGYRSIKSITSSENQNVKSAASFTPDPNEAQTFSPAYQLNLFKLAPIAEPQTDTRNKTSSPKQPNLLRVSPSASNISSNSSLENR